MHINKHSLLGTAVLVITQGMLQFTGLGYVGPKQEGW